MIRTSVNLYVLRLVKIIEVAYLIHLSDEIKTNLTSEEIAHSLDCKAPPSLFACQ